MADEDRFGSGLAMVDGDIDFDDQGRLRTLNGLPNLLQALTLRVLTPFGSDVFNVNYGMDIRQAFVQGETVSNVKQLIQLNLVRTISTDARVRDIREILFMDDPGYLERHPEITLDMVADARHRRVWQVEVVIDTITEATAALVVNVGA